MRALVTGGTGHIGSHTCVELMARGYDVACCYADASLAYALMGWRSEFGLLRMCQDAWRWQQTNPTDYA